MGSVVTCRLAVSAGGAGAGVDILGEGDTEERADRRARSGGKKGDFDNGGDGCGGNGTVRRTSNASNAGMIERDVYVVAKIR